MAGDSNTPKRRWLKWVGLQESEPDPEAWTAIATGIPIDEPATGTSDTAAGIVEILRRAGIEARQQVYVLPDQVKLTIGPGVAGDSGPDPASRLRVAVLVHNRDLERATGLPELQQELRHRQVSPLSDDELTRQSLQAGAELKRRTIDGG